MENFKFCALLCLNDWCQYDCEFVENLSPDKDEKCRLQCIQKMAENYRIVRNFKKISEDRRLKGVLYALHDVPDEITEENIDRSVVDLAARLKGKYGKNVISAASKFLWMLHKSPVVIFDSLAVKCLGRECGDRRITHDYAAYRKEWVRQYSTRVESIRSACEELVQVKEFSLAAEMRDDELQELVRNGWFHERVFDKFLWSNAKVT